MISDDLSAMLVIYWPTLNLSARTRFVDVLFDTTRTFDARCSAWTPFITLTVVLDRRLFDDRRTLVPVARGRWLARRRFDCFRRTNPNC